MKKLLLLSVLIILFHGIVYAFPPMPPFSGGTLTGALTFRAGNTGAGAAPAYFQAATALLGTPVGGAFEVSTDLNTLYYTIATGPARKTIAFTDSAMTGTVNGITFTSSAGSTFTLYAGSTLATSGAYTSTLLFQGSYTYTFPPATKTLMATDGNTSGTAANVSGTPALPNGTTATTQTAGDNSTKLATTAYVDTKKGYPYIPSGSMTPITCAGLATVSQSPNMTDYLAFDGATDEYAGFAISLEDWDLSTIKAKFVWYASAAMTNAHTVIWGLNCYAVSDGDTSDVAFSSGEVTVSDAYTTADETGPIQKTTAATAAITIQGTPAAGDVIYCRVSRDADTDTSTIDAWLVGVKLEYGKTVPTAW